MRISFLDLDFEYKHKHIDWDVINDCGLCRIFDDETCGRFTKVCSSEEIAERQKFFNSLMTDSFFASFMSFYYSLKELLGFYKLFGEAETACESLFVFGEYYQAFLAVLGKIQEIPRTDSVFCERLIAYADEQKNILRKNSDLFSEYKKLLSDISQSKVRIINGKAFLLKNSVCENERSAVEEIEYCKRSFGYIGESFEESRIKMSIPISETLNLLYEKEFLRLSEIKNMLARCIDTHIFSLKEEADFYLSVKEVIKNASGRGIPYSFAEISHVKEYRAKDIYDISLITKDTEQREYVANDVFFSEKEPCFFLVGANGGGKTTYLRAMASNLVLFLSGCPVFCESASIYPFDSLFTHFPAEEHFERGGRLFDEECRVKAITEKATQKSFVFLNETFTGADAEKGFSLSMKFMRLFYEKKVFCLFVTHFYDSAFSEIPVLRATVDKDNGNKRTFKMERGVGEKSSYAEDILKKYGLDALSLEKRRNMNDKLALQ